MILWYRKQRKTHHGHDLDCRRWGQYTVYHLFTSHTFRARLTEDDRGAAEVRIHYAVVA